MKIYESWNSLTDDRAREAFLRCCGSRMWVEAMLARRPFSTLDTLFNAVATAQKSMNREDWLEAFAAHPRLGDVESLRKKYATTAGWCSAEQAGVNDADEATLQELARGNAEYEIKFGHIFILCATGLSAGDMLASLTARLGNDPETELRLAAAEQAKITRLRLEKR